MKNKTVQVQVHNFPSGLLNAIKDQTNWENITVSTSPYPDGQSDYEIRHQGECVIRFSKWNGYGMGAGAAYLNMTFSNYELLNSIYPNHCRVWKVYQ